VIARRLLPALLLVLALGACKPPAETLASSDQYAPIQWQPGSWTLVWQDEFEGPANTAPDPTKWSYQLGGWGWGNKELQNYTDSLTNGALDGNGNLVITARAEMSGTNAYSSSRLSTQGHFSRAYGRFEARMRLENGKGLWPAFWVMGDDIDTAGWPTCGELDIMEQKGGSPGSISGSVHGPQAGAAIDVPLTRFVPVAGGSDTDFHLYAVEWDPDKIVFLVDDVPYLQTSPPLRPRWVYDHPFFIIVNLAVGGLYPGPPDATTPFPASIAIDWVRVSARADGGTDAAAGDDGGTDDAGANAAAADDDADTSDAGVSDGDSTSG
jgi:beta-glucanase (GH16 family)